MLSSGSTNPELDWTKTDGLRFGRAFHEHGPALARAEPGQRPVLAGLREDDRIARLAGYAVHL